METSTIIFIATVAIGFLILRWIITPIPHETPHEIEQIRRNTRSAPTDASAVAITANGNRQVTESMIEVVQAIAPQLTRGQIVHDLERSGSVEVTINRYMETGSLPFPPGEPRQQPARSESHNIPPSTVTLNLLEKYGIDESDSGEVKPGWGSNKGERSDNLTKKRQEMILNARKRLATQLQGDVPDLN